jgi:hypothetical protein
VYAGNSLTVGTGGTTHINKTGSLSILGGTVDLQSLPVYNGLLYFDSGSLSYLGYLDVGAASQATIRALGEGSQILANNRSLSISQGTYVHSGYTLTLDGGALSTSFLYTDHYSSSYGSFVFSRGTLTITGSDGLVLGPDNTGLNQLGFGFDVTADQTLIVTHTLTVVDSGYLSVINGTITAGAVVNNNVFNSYGGTISTGGLTNNGRMYFLNGLDSHGNVSSGTNVYGGVTNNSGILGIAVGHHGTNGNVTFWGDVINTSGSLFDVSTGSIATFEGNYSGDGILGGGEMHFAGQLSPGFSTASISLLGDVTVESTASLQIEIAGVNAESQFDHITVGGHLAIDGELNVSLLGGFKPAAGDSFDILDWSMLSGAFSDLTLPSLASGLIWDTSDLYLDGVIRVVRGIPGDYNNSGIVDAADYVAWRSNPAALPADAYDTWRLHFGQTAAGDRSIGSLAAAAAVPEPTCLIAWSIPLSLIAGSRCRGTRRRLSDRRAGWHETVRSLGWSPSA